MATKVNEDVTDVWVVYKQDQSNQELRNRLMERYLSLVRYNAERVWAKLPEGVDLNDLMSAGVFGLMDAIEAFDMERGVKFETYCVPRIRGATGRSGNVFGDWATWEHVAEIGQLDPDPLQCGRASDGRRRHRTCRDVSGCRRWKKHSCLRR